MRWCLLAAAAVGVLVSACSSSTTLNNGGGGAGSSGGGGSVDCAGACSHILAAGCPSPTQSECLSTCQQGAQQCPSQMSAAISCAEGQTVFCDGTGTANLNGCDAEQAAINQCAAGGSSSGVSGSSGGTTSSSGGGSGSSSGGQIPAGGSCATNGGGCVPITCTCNDGFVFGPISYCFNEICQGESDGCTELCQSDNGWSGH